MKKVVFRKLVTLTTCSGYLPPLPFWKLAEVVGWSLFFLPQIFCIKKSPKKSWMGTPNPLTIYTYLHIYMYVHIYVRTYIYVHIYIMYIKNEQVYFQKNVNRCIFNITHEQVCFHSKNEQSVFTHSILRKGFYPLPSPIPSLPLSLM